MCLYCKKQFVITKGVLKSRMRYTDVVKYCSKKCVLNDKKTNGVRSTRKCVRCGNSVVSYGKTTKYCSPECCYQHRIETNPRYVVLECTQCKKQFKRRLFEHRVNLRNNASVFCSAICNRLFHRGENAPFYGKPPKSYYGFREDLGHYCRSGWEANFCRILKYLGLSYQWESKTYNLGGTTYTPDIQVAGKNIEIKGWFREYSKNKIRLFKQKYPRESLIIIRQNHYKGLQKRYGFLPNWEKSRF